MKIISAKDAKNEFGLLLDMAQAEPVTNKKHGRAVAVIISVGRYDELRKRTEPLRGTGMQRTKRQKS